MTKKQDFLTRFGTKLDIPREALPGSFGLTLSGQNELTVRGCRRILRYGTTEICLLVGAVSLSIAGQNLICSAFQAGGVTITGKIECLTFAEAGK